MILTPLNAFLTAIVACTVIWKFVSDRISDQRKIESDKKIEAEKREAEIAATTAKHEAELAKEKAAALQATIDRQIENEKRLDSAWEKVDLERSAVNARFDAFQQSLIDSRERAVQEQSDMFKQIIQLRTDLGNAQQQLGEAQGHIKAAELEAARWKDNYDRKVLENMKLEDRVLTLEDKIRVYEDSRVTTTETFIQTRTPAAAGGD